MDKQIVKRMNKSANKFYELIENEGYSISDSGYKDNKTKVKTKCPRGHSYSVTPNSFKQGARCSACYNGNKKSKYADLFYREVFNDGYEVIEGKYNGVRSFVKVKCPEGHVYDIKVYNFMRGGRCSECYYKSIRDEHFNKFRDLIKEESYCIKENEVYRGANEHIKIICPNGHEYNSTPHGFMCGNRCKVCDGSSKLTTNELKIRVKNEVGNEYKVMDEYKGAHTNILFKHNNESCKHHEWYVKPNDFMQGTRCPKCNSSKGEKLVSTYLNENNINYESEKTFRGLELKGKLRYDFFIPEINILIEYDGKQHFEPVDFTSKGKEWAEYQFVETKKRDKIKTDYAKQIGLKLVRIPYWEKENIHKILDEEFSSLLV